MKVLWGLLAAAHAGRNADRKKVNKEKKQAFRKGIEIEALVKLEEVMTFDGIDMKEHIGEVYDAYLSDRVLKNRNFISLKFYSKILSILLFYSKILSQEQNS